MDVKKSFLLVVAAMLMLASCAGLRIFSQAQSEFDQGLASFNHGRYEEAIPRFQKATEIDPNFAQAYLYLGRTYLSLRKWREAIPPLRTALRLSPDETEKEVSNLLIDALLGAALTD